MNPNMVPRKISFLRPPTLLKCNKSGERPIFRSLVDTPPEHAFYQFWTTFVVRSGILWTHFCATIFDIDFEPMFRLSWEPVVAMEREARRKL